MNSSSQPGTPQPVSALPKKSLFRRFAMILFAGFAVWALIVARQIASFAQIDETRPADVAIVLGAATRRERPSPVFRERINHAIDLYQRGLVDAIILTGGEGNGRQVADSEIAKVYALDNEVPEEIIFIETSSRDTQQNLEQAKIIMTSNSFSTALVVSDPLHMYRAMQIADDLGLDAYSSPTTTSRYDSSWTQSIFLIRETFQSIWYSLFR
jgi:uncharacterized SAM-binding protein YcdF (DUF218 family)